MCVKFVLRQRVFSWFDSYDICDEHGNFVYRVEGKLDWGHKLLIYNAYGDEIAQIKEEVFTFMPKFYMIINQQEVGVIQKEFSFLKPKFHVSFNDWTITGDFLGLNYEVLDQGRLVMKVYQELFRWSDSYVVDIVNEQDCLYCLMITLAIDAAKCSQGN